MFLKIKLMGGGFPNKDMTDEEIATTITDYELDFKLPTTDVLKFGCDKLVEKIYETFPELIKIEPLLWQPQE